MEDAFAKAGAHGREWARHADREMLAPFFGPDPLRWLLGTAMEWTVIAGVFAVCARWPIWWVWGLGTLLIGTRQHGLGILAHEGVHYLVHPSRGINDVLANILSAYALTYPVQAYRVQHLKHHRTLDTSEDPERVSIDLYPAEWTYPMPRRRLFLIHLKDLVGLSTRAFLTLVKYIWAIRRQDLHHLFFIVLFHGVFCAAAGWTGHLFLLATLWYLPLITVAPSCFRLRTAAEHSGLRVSERRFQSKDVDTIRVTRTTVGGPVGAYLFAPHNMAYHVEHHLFPYVPVFKLKALHKKLMGNPDYASRVHVTRGYDALVRELTRAVPPNAKMDAPA